METPAEHLGYLHRRGFAPSSHEGYTEDEYKALCRYGHWLQALASGAIQAITPDQEHFLRVDQGIEAPTTIYEHAWVQHKKLKHAEVSSERSDAHANTLDMPSVASPYTDCEVVGMLRSLLARRRILSSVADSLLRQVEEGKSLSRKQLDCVHRLVLAAEQRERDREAHIITGQSRKTGSHRWRG